jgi:hypothetical protein
MNATATAAAVSRNFVIGLSLRMLPTEFPDKGPGRDFVVCLVDLPIIILPFALRNITTQEIAVHAALCPR